MNPNTGFKTQKLKPRTDENQLKVKISEFEDKQRKLRWNLPTDNVGIKSKRGKDRESKPG